MNAQELAAAIMGAKASKSGNEAKTGKYVYGVENISSFKGHGGDFFCGEFTVLQSTQTDPAIIPNPVGSSLSWVVNLGKGEGAQFGDIKSFIMALFGEPEDKVKDLGEAIVAMIDPKQPCQFLRVADEVYVRPQKKDKTKNFTHHKWSTVELTEAEILEIGQKQKVARDARVALAKK